MILFGELADHGGNVAVSVKMAKQLVLNLKFLKITIPSLIYVNW